MASTTGTLHAPGAFTAAAPDSFRLRRAGGRDVPALAAIEREAFPTQWPPTRFAREVKRPRTTYLVACRELPDELGAGSDNGNTGHSLLTRLASSLRQIFFLHPRGAGRPPRDYIAGFVAIWFIGNEAHIISIGVRRHEQHKGIGELLILGAIQEARRFGSTELGLEVRVSNDAAISLYRKYGFREVGVRKRYYIDNGEDAIIMTTPPIANAEFALAIDSLARNHALRWGYSLHPAA